LSKYPRQILILGAKNAKDGLPNPTKWFKLNWDKNWVAFRPNLLAKIYNQFLTMFTDRAS
jgi:hypothetical protein